MAYYLLLKEFNAKFFSPAQDDDFVVNQTLRLSPSVDTA